MTTIKKKRLKALRKAREKQITKFATQQWESRQNKEQYGFDHAKRRIAYADDDKLESVSSVRVTYRSGPQCVCGATMVRRTGKRGDFWGCSTYPRCTNTQEKQAE